jgi:hypothetical protein
MFGNRIENTEKKGKDKKIRKFQEKMGNVK